MFSSLGLLASDVMPSNNKSMTDRFYMMLQRVFWPKPA